MALKISYDKQSDIPKGAEEHYAEKNGKWVLDADYEDVSALKNAKQHEATARKTAEERVKALETELSGKNEELNGLREGAIPKGDVEALKKSYGDKYAKDVGERDTKLAELNKQLEGLVLGATVDKLSAELFDKNSVIGRPHVASRLRMETENGQQVVKVVDKDGKPSALTLDDLKKEMLQDKNFAGILVGSRASGGGANGGGGGGGAPSTDTKTFDAGKASPSDLVARIDAKRST